MAISGGGMPASQVEMRNGRPEVVRVESRQAAVLVEDLEIAETELLSGVSVWIPSRLFLQLRDRMTRSVQ